MIQLSLCGEDSVTAPWFTAPTPSAEQALSPLPAEMTTSVESPSASAGPGSSVPTTCITGQQCILCENMRWCGHPVQQQGCAYLGRASQARQTVCQPLIDVTVMSLAEAALCQVEETGARAATGQDTVYMGASKAMASLEGANHTG